jgi:serine/threonine protein kinase/WD40 repeat protein
MTDLHLRRDPVEELAEEFLARYRRGEHPALTEYAERHPELADEIRDLFPALLLLEEAGRTQGTPFGAPGLAPERLGGYRIVREVGRGGMGVVYEAEQEALGRRVALKVLPAALAADATCLLRFRREARSAARLHHSNIVPVFDVGEAAGVHYYAMQFIRGQGLDEVLRQLRDSRNNWERSEAETVPMAGDRVKSPAGPEPLAPTPDGPPTDPGRSSLLRRQSDDHYFHNVARLGLQVAEALAYAHGQRVLHRDIKPANLLLDLQGTLWVSDFGLAKEEGDDLTRTGDVVGTLRYMAPERFNGAADMRSDVYSLGATLYELLALRPAFGEANRERLVRQVLHETPPPPSRVDPRVPRDLETIVLKALSKEPTGRYQSAADLAEDLRRFLTGRPIRARRSSAPERLGRWCRRNPVVAALAALVVTLVATVAVIASLDAWRLRQEEAATRRQLYDALVAQARASRLSRRAGQRFESLKALEAAARIARQLNLPEKDFLELRSEAIACLALPDLRVAHEWPGWPEGSARLDFDAALACYVRTDQRGTASIRRVADDRQTCEIMSGLSNATPRLSPDGRYLALADPPQLQLWELGGSRRIDDPPELACAAHDFSLDGRWLAAVQVDGAIHLYDLPSGGRIRQLPPGPCAVHSAAFHPDSRRLAVSHGGGVQVRDLATDAVVCDLLLTGAEHLTWHPDGKTLAAVGGDRVIHQWDVTTGQELSQLSRWKNDELRISFNRSGDLLASVGREQMLRLWEPRIGSELFHTPAGFAGTSLRFGGDRLLAGGIKDDRLCLWEVVTGQECRRLIRNPARGEAPHCPFSVSPAGPFLAVRTLDGFGLWDRHTGLPLASVQVGPLDDVAFEPSGTLLTAGPAGIFRWALRPDPGAAGTMRLGPPERLPLPGTRGAQVAGSAYGRAVVCAQCWGGLVLHAEQLDHPVRLEPHPGARSVAISPDRRWAATGGEDGTGVRVWDARTGEAVKDLVPQEGWVRVGFSPDGRWLATRGKSLRLWSVGSWQEGRSLGGIAGTAFAFSPAENLLAMETGYGTVCLIDPDTGREYARLAEPDQVKVTWICFSPDGQELLASGAGNDAWIRVWDLRSIRRQLAAMDLDWGLPPYPPAKERNDAPPRVVVDASPVPAAKP